MSAQEPLSRSWIGIGRRIDGCQSSRFANVVSSPKVRQTPFRGSALHPCVVAGKTPDKAAVIMAATGETLTYRQLEERSNQGAQLIRELGLKAGDSVAVFMENNILFLPICWAAQRAGLYYTCISSRL